jgi:hypothetical protein
MTACGSCIDTYNATIPASAVTTDLAYYLNVSDGVNVALSGTAATPHLIAVNRYPTAATLNSLTAVTHDAMTLTWTASGDADFANYTVYQSTAKEALGTLIATITDASTTTYTVTGLSPATTYYFTVRVDDVGGLSVDTNTVSGTTLATPSPAEFPWLYLIVALAVIGVVAAFLVRRTIL